MITYTTVTNPKYVSQTNDIIELLVSFNHLLTPVLFNATLNDIEPHGVELYNRALAGDFGPIAAFMAPTPPTLTQEDFTRAIQKVLDDKAKEKGFDNMISASSYIGFTNPYQAEALKLNQWRAETWVAAEAILADVTNNVRPIPTIVELLGELPVYVE